MSCHAIGKLGHSSTYDPELQRSGRLGEFEIYIYFMYRNREEVNRPFSKMAPADGGMAWDRNRKLQLKIVSSVKAKIVKYAESWLDI